MALTVTNVNTIKLLNILNANSAAQANTLAQLASGKRINTAKDDPSGLVALSSLNTELRAVESSLLSNQRTDSMLTVADQAMLEVSSLLGEIETLVMASSSNTNLTASEISANQSQIDDALAAIDRIVQGTVFNGKRLLDGSFSIQSTGVNANFVEGLRVFSRSQSTSDSVLTVSRVASAQKAEVAFHTGQVAGAQLETSGTTEVAIAGALGTATVTLVDGLALSGVIVAINNVSDQTGVTAVLSTTVHDAGTSSINLQSTTFGTAAFVSVDVLSGGALNKASGTPGNGLGPADDFSSVSKTLGVDANITINGQTVGTDGLDVSYSANGLSLEFTLDTAFGEGSQATTSSAFTVLASGGATFQLGTTANTRATIGLDTLATYNLGGGNGTSQLSQIKSGGSVDLNSDVEAALTTVREAISEVAGVRSRLGGFQKYQVGSSLRSLQAAQVGLSSAASVIEDVDFAVATAELSRQGLLIQAGVTLLGVANQRTTQILSLLQQT